MVGGFKAWLNKQQHRNDLVGDLARDAAVDSDWPRGGASLERLVRYLEDEHSAVPGAVEALRRAYAEWEESKREKPVESIADRVWREKSA